MTHLFAQTALAEDACRIVETRGALKLNGHDLTSNIQVLKAGSSLEARADSWAKLLCSEVTLFTLEAKSTMKLLASDDSQVAAVELQKGSLRILRGTTSKKALHIVTPKGEADTYLPYFLLSYSEKGNRVIAYSMTNPSTEWLTVQKGAFTLNYDGLSQTLRPGQSTNGFAEASPTLPAPSDPAGFNRRPTGNPMN